jgi:predicted nucleic acid-binding protein
MKIYLNVSCLNRPFDDQQQTRIRLESAAIAAILERIDDGQWTHISSDMAVIEIEAIPDTERQARVRRLLPNPRNIRRLAATTFRRADELGKLGFKPADAVHVAAAEESRVDVLLSCDDRFCRLGAPTKGQLRVEVANPLDWLKEMGHDNDA